MNALSPGTLPPRLDTALDGGGCAIEIRLDQIVADQIVAWHLA